MMWCSGTEHRLTLHLKYVLSKPLACGLTKVSYYLQPALHRPGYCLKQHFLVIILKESEHHASAIAPPSPRKKHRYIPLIKEIIKSPLTSMGLYVWILPQTHSRTWAKATPTQGSSPEGYQEAITSLRRPEILGIAFDSTDESCPHCFSTSSKKQHRALAEKPAMWHCMPQLQECFLGYAEMCLLWNQPLCGDVQPEPRIWAEPPRFAGCWHTCYWMLGYCLILSPGWPKTTVLGVCPSHAPRQPREKT